MRSREARSAELSRSISMARVLTTSGCDFSGAIFVPPRKNGRKSCHFSKFSNISKAREQREERLAAHRKRATKVHRKEKSA